MKKIAILALALFFSGCSTNMFQVQNSVVTTQNCAVSIPLSYKESFDVFGRLSIDRAVYATKNGSALVFESGDLDNDYEFVIGPISIINAAFKLTNMQSQSVNDFVEYSQGTAQNGEIIYILGSFYPQNFTFIYSSDKAVMDEILQCVRANKNEGATPQAYNFTLKQPAKSAIYTQWGPAMVFMTQIYARKSYGGIYPRF